MRAKINGRSWDIVFEPITVDVAECDWDEHRIVVDPNVPPQELLDSLIHELLHACLPVIEEDTIGTTAETISGVLWSRGYRMRSPRH